MAAAAPCTRIPDIILQRAGGGEINLSAFIGQELVVIFCPADPAAVGREIEAYRSLAGEFQNHGVWILGVLAGESDPPPRPAGEPSIALVHDRSGSAWAAFAPWLDRDASAQRAQGAVFLFERWGCFDRAWAGTGHAKEVLEESRRWR